MKVAVVYNRESRKVIDLFGTANREKIRLTKDSEDQRMSNFD